MTITNIYNSTGLLDTILHFATERTEAHGKSDLQNSKSILPPLDVTISSSKSLNMTTLKPLVVRLSLSRPPLEEEHFSTFSKRRQNRLLSMRFKHQINIPLCSFQLAVRPRRAAQQCLTTVALFLFPVTDGQRGRHTFCHHACEK